ncbi:MAG TPA: Calx-beta domain-containing protein, partial [Chitinophagales bacterium]|nr:Calx-beta domain-containing protein [Chitinophagales bacterium]
MVVVSDAAFTSAVPTGNGSAYTANSANFTDALNTTFDGGKVVYKGTANTMTVTALTNGTTYHVKVFTRKGSNWTAGVTTTATPAGGMPTITVTPTSITLVTSAGNPSMPGSYNVSGSNLSNDIVITAPAGVELSTSFYGPFASTLNLAPTGSSVASTKIWVRLTGASYTSGTIANATTGGSTQNVTVTGTVNNVSVTELLVPQFMQGLNGTNSSRVPYLFRATLSGLLPNATYRYFPGVVDSTDTYTASGAGAPIFVDNQSSFTQSSGGAINTVGSYSTFTTNASGSYTGWFGITPTGNARFVPGRSLYVRITTNNGAGGTAAANYVTLPSPIKIQDLVAGRAQPLFGVSSALEKNFVVIYDNTTGTGRPIASSTVENDGATPNSYAGFYNSQVNGVTGAWGTIIPSNLPNGIRRIEQRDFATGNIIGCATDADGVWPTGNVNTVNPAGGTTAIQIASADAPLTCCVGGPTATATLSVSSTSLNENSGSVTVTATACTAVTGSQTVQVVLSGTATNGVDYTLSNTTITIAAGQTTGSVTLSAVNDALVEGTETVVLTLANPSSGLVLGTPITQTVSIIDEDVPVATLATSTNTADESNASIITLTVTTDNPTLASETFNLNFTGTATLGSDYTASATTVTIPAGNTSGTATVTILNDALREADETTIVTLTTASTSAGVGSPNSQTIALVDDDDAILLTGLNVTTATSTFNELATTGSGISFVTNMPRGSYFAETGSNANTTYRTDNGGTNT